MKKYLLTTLLLIQIITGYSATDSLHFAKHSIELNFSPDFDYYMFANHNDASKANRQFEKDNAFPFVGFSLGVSYGYRPVKSIAISAGINSRIYGSYIRLPLQDTYVIDPYTFGTSAPQLVFSGLIKQYNFQGSLTFPLLAHLFLPCKKANLEFATGPEFYLPFYVIIRFEPRYFDGATIESNTLLHSTYSSTQVKSQAALGWNFQFGDNIPIRRSCNLFIGPEFVMFNALYFQKKDFPTNEGRFIYYSLGIKLGFRFGLSRRSS